LKKGFLAFLTFFLLVVILIRTDAASTTSTLLGDESDGSLAQPNHQ
jgi:hypothetical protein